jgi:hypothetical protein
VLAQLLALPLALLLGAKPLLLALLLLELSGLPILGGAPAALLGAPRRSGAGGFVNRASFVHRV